MVKRGGQAPVGLGAEEEKKKPNYNVGGFFFFLLLPQTRAPFLFYFTFFGAVLAEGRFCEIVKGLFVLYTACLETSGPRCVCDVWFLQTSIYLSPKRRAKRRITIHMKTFLGGGRGWGTKKRNI